MSSNGGGNGGGTRRSQRMVERRNQANGVDDDGQNNAGGRGRAAAPAAATPPPQQQGGGASLSAWMQNMAALMETASPDVRQAMANAMVAQSAAAMPQAPPQGTPTAPGGQAPLRPSI